MASKVLPPIDFAVEAQYEPHSERVEVKINKCKHKDVTYVNAREIRCQCGSAWGGANISELYNLFKKQ